jgi:hypothetical protein
VSCREQAPLLGSVVLLNVLTRFLHGRRLTVRP